MQELGVPLTKKQKAVLLHEERKNYLKLDEEGRDKLRSRACKAAIANHKIAVKVKLTQLNTKHNAKRKEEAAVWKKVLDFTKSRVEGLKRIIEEHEKTIATLTAKNEELEQVLVVVSTQLLLILHKLISINCGCQ